MMAKNTIAQTEDKTRLQALSHYYRWWLQIHNGFYYKWYCYY